MKRALKLSWSICLLAQAASAVDPGTLYRNTIPEDKHLDPAWVESLTERGHPLDRGIFGSKKDDTLKYIGMPVGGIGCGTVYLSGDGRLYVWDIWNQGHAGILPNSVPPPEGFPAATRSGRINAASGSSYLNPLTVEKFAPGFSQGFAIRLKDGSLKEFNSRDWKSVEFSGKWPIATVSYADSKRSLQVELKSYSPFVPLSLDDSTMPVTVMSYRLTNVSDQPVSAELVGWLENMSVQPVADEQGTFTSQSKITSLNHACEMNIPAGRGKDKGLPASVHKGTMALSYLGAGKLTTVGPVPGIATDVVLKPGESREFTFLITWHFPVIRIREALRAPSVAYENEYALRFKNATAVADHVAQQYERLSEETQQWVDTWNESTLPQWLLDRTILTADTLQTANCVLLGDGKGGRFWAWEGIGVCHGTCTHVWHYAQAMARLFPSLERNLREKTDFGFAQLPNGVVPFRGTVEGAEGGGIAIDGQCGTVLRSYREHLISADDSFLKTNWPKIKQALEYLIDFDRNDGNFDGLLHGKQHNTLDASWYGKVHAISSLYIAALRAGEEMAKREGDTEFETLCRDLYHKGSTGIEVLYNGEYYVQEEDPNHPEAIGVGPGVYIDQVIGQFWANQLGLGRLYNEEHMQSALNTLWKYNFVPDIASFRETFREGRYYAWTGDAGLIMCTWPNGGLNENFRNHRPYRYFNECMSGFEYQAAAHMVAEGTPELITQGLAVTRAIHDRYRPEARNPYNEIECSDHYARAMSSYAVFLAACGFVYDGPAGVIGFDPVIHPEDFRAPFTAAEGWGTFSQTIDGRKMQAKLALNWGSLSLKTLRLNPRGSEISKVAVSLEGKRIDVKLVKNEHGVSIDFAEPVLISAGQVLAIELFNNERISSALPVTKTLVLDLNADVGVTVEEESMVTAWRNQAPNPKALDFKITEEGRTKTIISQEELGTGRPTLKKNTDKINGHNSLVFREDELINDNDEAFHGMMTGGGYTWFAVIKPYTQGGPGKINSRYPNAFFGCLRNTGKPQLEPGQYAGFWGSFYPDGRVYMGSRNGLNEKVRDGVNTPEVEGPPPSTNEWHIIMGRQGSGQGVVQLELFVNDPSEAVNSHDYPVANVEPSRMAIGTERNAINHQGKESFDGELARLLMFETALDQQEMTAVYDYLRTGYFE